MPQILLVSLAHCFCQQQQAKPEAAQYILSRSVCVSDSDILRRVLLLRLSKLLVRLDQPHPQCPSRSNRHECKGRIARHCSQIFRSVALRIQVCRVDVRRIRNYVDNGQTHSFLLTRLAQRRRHPAQDAGVDRVRAAGEHEAGHVPRGGIHRCARDDEADERDSHAAGDVPCPFIELARRDADDDTRKPGNEIRRAGEHERDGPVKAKAADHPILRSIELAFL